MPELIRAPDVEVAQTIARGLVHDAPEDFIQLWRGNCVTSGRPYVKSIRGFSIPSTAPTARAGVLGSTFAATRVVPPGRLVRYPSATSCS